MKAKFLEDIRIESDETEEFFSRLERCFGITIEQMKISNGMTLQNLFDNITAELSRTPIHECTSQKVFFRLRELLVKEYGYEKQTLSPRSAVKDVFPSSSRRKLIEGIGRHFQIKMDYFQAPGWFQLLTVLTLLGSFIYLFVNVGIAIIGIVASILLISISQFLSNSLPFQDLGQLVKRITIDNLLKFQGSEKNINLNDAKFVLISIIKDLHGLEDHEISFDQRIRFA